MWPLCCGWHAVWPGWIPRSVVMFAPMSPPRACCHVSRSVLVARCFYAPVTVVAVCMLRFPDVFVVAVQWMSSAIGVLLYEGRAGSL
eukprot:8891203-Prorocentrum_lima.AAC.1